MDRWCCQRFKDVVGVKDLQGTISVILLIMLDLFWKESKRTEEAVDMLSYLFFCADFDFIQSVLNTLFRSEKYVFPKMAILKTIDMVYDFPDPLGAAKILFKYSLDFKFKFKSDSFYYIFSQAARRNDYPMLHFLEEINIRPDIPLSRFYWYSNLRDGKTNFAMLQYFANLSDFDMFSDPDDVKETLKAMMYMLYDLADEDRVQMLKMTKFIYDRAGKMEYFDNVPGTLRQPFFSYMNMRARLEKKAANRIYFWVYPILYRNKDFVLKQAERSWQDLQTDLAKM
jgi:hypothetical protein